LNKTHQFLVNADGVNILGGNINTVKKNNESLLQASKDVGLEVNSRGNKYVMASRHQDAGQYHNIKIANEYFDSVAKFRYLETTVSS
jgi:hypothetical protein